MNKKADNTGITVVKIGGVALSSQDTTFEDIVSLQHKSVKLVVVHGGANIVNRWLDKQGVTTSFVNGERVTDHATLEMVTAVLAGLVNKEIVAAINCLGGRAFGLSGVDGGLLGARAGDKAMGFVGRIEHVAAAPLVALIEAGFVPVVAPISLNLGCEAPHMLNCNGDTVAGEIAAAVGVEKLIFLTDVVGILDGSGKLIEELSGEEAEALITSGVAKKGMIPKIRAGVRTLSKGGVARIVDGRCPHALTDEIAGKLVGTTIRR
ncbi:MAG: acetylglutamate kinase [Dehalococcoidia bacterium]|nr:MAG: acetylglutamate kinase [Dehalococcoidia bacterium]